MLRMIVLVLTVLVAGAQAQDAPRGPGRFGPGPGRGGPRFLGAEAGMPGRVVKNAPYSADIVTERVQVLSDGNRIRQTSTARVYRDSQGRSRREQSLNGLGALAPDAGVSRVIFITDPVAGANFALNPKDRTATKTAWGPRRMRPRGGEVPERPMGMGVGRRMRGAEASGQNVRTESLGRQTIEGLPADGTRTTITIPAGQVGNEQPIQIVRESWYSPDLQMIVLSKVTDPRFGETTYKVTNITRGEPARTLFEVPADYKISER